MTSFEPDYIIIGSGLSGISAAIPLLEKKNRVLMIDPGIDLDPFKLEIKRKLAKGYWSEETVTKLKGEFKASPSGVEKKLVYGSDHPYAGMDVFQTIKLTNANIVRSLACGGLGTVWGAAVLPCLDHDLHEWPVNVADLSPHYQSIMLHIPHAFVKDDLEDLFPLYTDQLEPLNPSMQARSFLADLKNNASTLKKAGIYFGASRLAVTNQNNEEKGKCTYCSLCLYGCPYDLIYSPVSAIGDFEKNSNFTYIRDVLVDKIVENGNDIAVYGRSLATARRLVFRAGKVFLAAGLLSSTRIILRSMGAYNRYVVIRHSEHFQVPIVRKERIEGVCSEKMHTLAQVFLDLIDDEVCKRTVHMQIYTYNDLYAKVLRKMAGPLGVAAGPFIDHLLSRLLIIKGYLHSDYSSSLLARLEPGEEGALLVEGLPNPEASEVVNRVLDKLNAVSFAIRAKIIKFAAKIGLPGTANHSGGSFPMRAAPSAFESDILGRPVGFSNLHVVDATVLPSIPATTISLTIMANAHRISEESIK